MAWSTAGKVVAATLTALGLGSLVALAIRRPPGSLATPTLDPPIDAEGCSRKYFPSPNQSARAAMPPIWIVIHDTEGGASAAAVASYFFNPATDASAHLVVDNDGACYRCVDDDRMAWHAGPANPKSLGIELVAPEGAYKWSAADWLTHERLLEAAAARVARWVKRYNLPVRFVGPAGLKRGDRGITTHAAVTEALGGSHGDPGKSFPMEDFLRRVARRLAIT
jgi:N-acetyl-anhydromuramyl-L-alanine amidase AmpD